MPLRSLTFVRKVMIGPRVVPVIRPVLGPSVNMAVRATFRKPMTMNRFYATSGHQQSSKISSMASSPELIQAAKAEPKQSKLRELTKKYGVVGVLVYLGVGCVDLGISFGVIQFAGLDKVKALEKGALDVIYNTGERFGIKKKTKTESDVIVSEQEDSTPSLASVFILAYGIHKTLLLPVRLGITAAITPAIVRKLHQLGWNRYFPRLLGASVPKKP